jgi:23S rRNA (guanine745-N1)-methyltransferase
MRCVGGHDFDIAREGYVNLTTPRTAKLRSDTRAMVEARVRLHTGRLFDRLQQELIDRARERAAPTVADLGCGPGTYLRALLDGISGRGVGVDLSKDAIRHAARTHKDAAFVVGDVSRRIPLASASFDIVLNAFAPRNAAEMRRIVHGDGLSIVVAAGPDHLRELVENLGLLQVPSDKRGVLKEQFSGHFDLVEIDSLTYPMTLEPEELRAAVLMGPSSWHLTDAQRQTLEAMPGMQVTADVLILTARPRS